MRRTLRRWHANALSALNYAAYDFDVWLWRNGLLSMSGKRKVQQRMSRADHVATALILEAQRDLRMQSHWLLWQQGLALGAPRMEA